jgi:hypothetical protein
VPPDSASPGEFSAVLLAELGCAWRTTPFWIVVTRQAIPIVGVMLFDWPAFDIAVYFVVESWLMLSLYAATDLTFNPKYAGTKARSGGAIVIPLLKQFLAAGLLIAFIVGMFGGFLLLEAFPREDASAFLEGGWRERSFLIGLLVLAGNCLADAVHFAQRIPRRTPEEVAADDVRIAGTFYRVVLLFMASGLIGVTAPWGFAAPLFVIALGLVLTFFEGLPRSAALLLGKKLA